MAPRYTKEHKDMALEQEQPLFTLDLWYSKTGRRTTIQGVSEAALEEAIRAALCAARKQ